MENRVIKLLSNLNTISFNTVQGSVLFSAFRDKYRHSELLLHKRFLVSVIEVRWKKLNLTLSYQFIALCKLHSAMLISLVISAGLEKSMYMNQFSRNLASKCFHS